MTDYVKIEKQEFQNLLFYKKEFEERSARLNLFALRFQSLDRKWDLGNYDKNESSKHDLSQRHLDILQILKSNPGCNKQFVVNSLNDKYSRVTIFNLLDDLIQWDLIVTEKEKPNSQTYKIFIKDEDLSLGLIKDLEVFEKVFFQLTYKIKQNDNKSMLFDILNIFFDMVDMCLLISFIHWTHEIKNKRILYYTNGRTFEKLMEFQSRLMIDLEDIDRSLLSNYIDLFSEKRRFLSLKSYSNCYIRFKESGFEREIGFILDFLFDIRNKLIGVNIKS